MMSFDKTPAHDDIAAAVRAGFSADGIKAVRADDKHYNPGLYLNVQTYMDGCGMGVAIFDRIMRDQFNPNIALEIGYMLGRRKPVLLLKDSTLDKLQTDLLGHLHWKFDSQNAAGTIPAEIKKWIADKGLSRKPLINPARGTVSAEFQEFEAKSPLRDFPNEGVYLVEPILPPEDIDVPPP